MQLTFSNFHLFAICLTPVDLRDTLRTLARAFTAATVRFSFADTRMVELPDSNSVRNRPSSSGVHMLRFWGRGLFIPFSYLLTQHIGDLTLDGIFSHQLELRVRFVLPNGDFSKSDVDRPVPKGKPTWLLHPI
jgi:hypothetical protein